MNKDKLINFINSQIEGIERKLRDLECEDYDYENIHNSIDFFGEAKRLNGSKDSLIVIKRMVENGI